MYGMQALKRRQEQVALQYLNQAIGQQEKEAEDLKIAQDTAYNEAQYNALLNNNLANPKSANIRQLILDSKDLQTGAKCGTCDLFLAAAIDQVVKKEAINAQNIHNALQDILNYHSCMCHFTENIFAEHFVRAINEFGLSNDSTFIKRVFVLGYINNSVTESSVRVEDVGRTRGRLAELSLGLRKGTVQAVHFVCNLAMQNWQAGHWVLFSVVNYGGTITIWYLDSLNGKLNQEDNRIKAYIEYIRNSMLLSV
jgi:hypothetical protein